MENSGMSNNDKADKIRKMRSLSAFLCSSSTNIL